MKIRMWKIFYQGGATFSNRDGRPEDAPARGIQVVTQSSDLVGRLVIRQADYYTFGKKQGGWQGVDIFGLFDYLVEPGLKVVKFGRMIGNSEYMKILQTAVDDPELPTKAGWHRLERRMDH